MPMIQQTTKRIIIKKTVFDMPPPFIISFSFSFIGKVQCQECEHIIDIANHAIEKPPIRTPNG